MKSVLKLIIEYIQGVGYKDVFDLDYKESSHVFDGI